MNAPFAPTGIAHADTRPRFDPVDDVIARVVRDSNGDAAGGAERLVTIAALRNVLLDYETQFEGLRIRVKRCEALTADDVDDALTIARGGT
jgi:hypothetical protein